MSEAWSKMRSRRSWDFCSVSGSGSVCRSLRRLSVAHGLPWAFCTMGFGPGRRAAAHRVIRNARHPINEVPVPHPASNMKLGLMIVAASLFLGVAAAAQGSRLASQAGASIEASGLKAEHLQAPLG